MAQSATSKSVRSKKRKPKYIVLNGYGPQMTDPYTPSMYPPPYASGPSHYGAPSVPQYMPLPSHHAGHSAGPGAMRCTLCERSSTRPKVSKGELWDKSVACSMMPFEWLVRCMSIGMRTCVNTCDIIGNGCENCMTGVNFKVEQSFLNCEKGMYNRMGHHHGPGGCPIHGMRAMEQSYPGPPPPSAMMQHGYHSIPGHHALPGHHYH